MRRGFEKLTKSFPGTPGSVYRNGPKAGDGSDARKDRWETGDAFIGHPRYELVMGRQGLPSVKAAPACTQAGLVDGNRGGTFTFVNVLLLVRSTSSVLLQGARSAEKSRRHAASKPLRCTSKFDGLKLQTFKNTRPSCTISKAEIHTFHSIVPGPSALAQRCMR